MINSALQIALRPRALRPLSVAEIMTPHLLTFDERMPIQKAVELLRSNDRDAAPVVNDYGRLTGIVTLESCTAWEDFSRRSSARGVIHDQPDFTPVRDISSPTIDCIQADAPARQVIEQLVKRTTQRVYVVNRDGEVVGVVGMADLARYFINTDLAPTRGCVV